MLQAWMGACTPHFCRFNQSLLHVDAVCAVVVATVVVIVVAVVVAGVPVVAVAPVVVAVVTANASRAPTSRPRSYRRTIQPSETSISPDQYAGGEPPLRGCQAILGEPADSSKFSGFPETRKPHTFDKVSG